MPGVHRGVERQSKENGVTTSGPFGGHYESEGKQLRKEFELSEKDHEFLLDACKPVPYMVIGGHLPSSPQENANRAWECLGNKLGFKHLTVKPVPGKSSHFFTAEAEPESEV